MYIELSTVCTIYSYWIMNRIQCRENSKIWNDRKVWKPSTVFWRKKYGSNGNYMQKFFKKLVTLLLWSNNADKNVKNRYNGKVQL